jgi:hypothetical protein
MSPRFVLVLALTLSHIGLCAAATCVAPVLRDRATMEIAGVLHGVVEWGPPNFGEHPESDSRWTAWIIDLPAPLAISGGVMFGGKLWTTVSQIQIKMLASVHEGSDNALLLPYEGKLVAVTGKLFPATVISDVTPVGIDGEHVRLADHPTCRVLDRDGLREAIRYRR